MSFRLLEAVQWDITYLPEKILDCKYLNETDAVFSTSAESQFHHSCSGAENVRMKLERPSPFQYKL